LPNPIPFILPPLFLALVAMFLIRNRRAFGGFWLWEQIALQRRGITTWAKLLAIVDKGFADASGRVAYSWYELVVEIALEGRAPYRVSITARMKPYESVDLKEGSLVPVRIHPTKPNRVMFDGDELARRKEAVRDAKRGADEQRARALMSGDDRRP
jgi:hypothetical protein